MIGERAAGAIGVMPDPHSSCFHKRNKITSSYTYLQTFPLIPPLNPMVLSDADIKRCLEDGTLNIEPRPDVDTHIGPCSVDFTLGAEFRVFEHSRHAYFDVRQKVDSEEITRLIEVKTDEPFIIQPGELALAVTVETLTLPPTLLARLEGRSSLGRIGIIVHGTAPRFDPGFHGRCVMELGNIGPMAVALYPGMPICSLTFEQLSSPAERPYGQRPGSKYFGQSGPVASRLAQE